VLVVGSVRSVSALAIRRRLRRHRRDLAVIATVLVMAALLALHHSGLLTDMQHHAGMGDVIQMCLAVFTTAAAVLVAAAAVLCARRRLNVPLRLVPAGALPTSAVPVARARHGPGAVSLLCVSRR
jgi:hypothetical protein